MKKKQVNAGEILRSNYFQFPSGNPYLTMSATTKNTWVTHKITERTTSRNFQAKKWYHLSTISNTNNIKMW